MRQNGELSVSFDLRLLPCALKAKRMLSFIGVASLRLI